MRLFFWKKQPPEQPIQMALLLQGSKNYSLEKVLGIIKSLGVENACQNRIGLIELSATHSQASELKRLLPDWNLVPIEYNVRVPEHDSGITNTEPNNTILEELIEEADSHIHEYLKQAKEKVKLVDLVAYLRTKKIKWQYVMKVINQSNDIEEDGTFVWLIDKDSVISHIK